MPRKKTTSRTKVVARKNDLKSQISARLSNLNLGKNSYTSLIYGVITVVVIFVLLLAGFRILNQNKMNQDITEDGLQTLNQEQSQNLYEVKQGDTLWSIAEKELGDGFKWTEIAKANNLKNGSVIEKGAKIVIPGREEVAVVTSPTVTELPTTTLEPLITTAPTVTQTTTASPMPVQENTKGGRITGDVYVVQPNDNLWDICVRAYGDGYRWPKVAQDNKLFNPDVIHAGNRIVLNR